MLTLQPIIIILEERCIVNIRLPNYWCNMSYFPFRQWLLRNFYFRFRLLHLSWSFRFHWNTTLTFEIILMFCISCFLDKNTNFRWSWTLTIFILSCGPLFWFFFRALWFLTWWIINVWSPQFDILLSQWSFFALSQSLPLFHDLRNDLWLPNFWILVSVFFEFHPWELAINFCKLFHGYK